MFRIEPRLQQYDWGMAGTIPKMLGLAPVDGPVAEAWWGAHPSAPSALAAPGSGTLADAIVADRSELLGAGFAELPFLLKILAIAKPLSIQVHPTAARAREGFAAENALAVPLDAPRRTFRDPRHKPEMIVAITPMRLLSGFRGRGPLAADLAALVGEGDELVAAVRGDDGIRTYLLAVLDGRPRPDLLATLERAADDDSAIGFAGRAARAFRADRGALVALAMNPVLLGPGEASFVPARQVHSYQSGVGVEIMSNSDNVVRGGLTTKPVDVALFESIVDATPSAPLWPDVSDDRGRRTYVVPAEEFALSRIDRATLAMAPAPRIVLAVDGPVAIAAGGTALTLDAGQAAFVGHGDGAMEVTASALAFVAQPGARRG